MPLLDIPHIVLTFKKQFPMVKRLSSIVASSIMIAALILATPVNADSKVTTGGRFILKSHTGKIVTDQDFAGKFMLVYFGYTYCPDICPTSLQTMTLALEELGDQAKHFQPLFISVDPERDTPKVLAEYVSSFYPGMIGLTGSKVTIDSVTKKYRVKFSKVAEKNSDDDDYSVDHTSAIFLMGFDGRYLSRFGYNTTSQQMADKLKQFADKVTDQ